MANKKRGCNGRTVTSHVSCHRGTPEKVPYVKVYGYRDLGDAAEVRIVHGETLRKSNTETVHPARALREEGKRLRMLEKVERRNAAAALGRSVNRVWSGRR